MIWLFLFCCDVFMLVINVLIVVVYVWFFSGVFVL